MIYDYYDIEAYEEESNDFFNKMEQYGQPNPFSDIYLSFLELPEDMKYRFFKDYEIDMDAYLFFLVRFFGLKSPIQRKRFLKHPYIRSLVVENRINHLQTPMGEVEFQYWINGIPDILKKTFQNLGYSSIIDSFCLFRDEFIGAYNGRCHEASIQFSGQNDVVTAFMHEPLSNLRFLHSFVETDEKILETTANIVMKKEDYYRLTRPEVITKIPGEELLDLWNSFFQKHPRLKDMNIKQLLTEYEEVKQHPDTIKIKTIRTR